ncbi:MAG: tetratricopeptide repeat protein [Syntrophobacterales bacterium]|nr:MAG: tetratricopeptide repeat protein [Syntrophobacterales bacterium]
MMRAMSYIRSIRVYLIIIGGLCLCYGVYQKYWYSDLIKEAAKAMEENRLDRQYLEKASESLFASGELISYNMGVRAYHANNLKKASEHFYDIIRKGDHSFRKKRAYYNLGNILVRLDLPKKAAQMYREALRLDPTDWESKYNLERLYVFYPMAFPDEGSQASLDQEPGEEEEDKSSIGKPTGGQPGADQPDI